MVVDDEIKQLVAKGSHSKIEGYIYVAHVNQWYEPNLFTNWVGMAYNRIGTAKKKSSKEYHSNLLEYLRSDYLKALQTGNFTYKLTSYIKNYPERVGEDVANWYKEASVQSV